MISIERFDESFVFIRCDLDEAIMISSWFEFFAPNYFFNPKFRAGMWDGKIKLFQKRTGLLPQGLVPRLIYYLKKLGIEYKIENINLYGKKISKKNIENFCKMIKCPYSTSGKREYQASAVQNMIYRKKMVVKSATSCHAKGQKIIMYDGSFKNVEDVKVGDILLGPDGKKRTVLKLFNGKDELFDIIPKRGESFRVTGEHILSLKSTIEGKKRYNGKTGKEIKNISVYDYNKKTKYFKNIWKLYKSEAINTWKDKNITIDPYILGLLLGNGCFKYGSISITTMDKEIVNEFKTFANNINCSITENKKSNSKATTYLLRGTDNGKSIFINLINKLGLLNKDSSNKFIPNNYKYSSIKTRIELLSGILDADGNYNKNGNFDYITKSKELAEDVAFICRSIGLTVNKITKCEKSCQNKFIGTYYRLCILGNLSIIKCRLKRKQEIKYKKRTRSNIVGFDVKYYGIDEYYGFELDKDHLYLLDDFTVTHNSGKSFMAFLFFSILKYFYDHFKFLLIVPNTNLVEQMTGDFKEYAENWCDYSQYVEKIYSDAQKITDDRPIVVSTWQSLQHKPEKYFKQFNAIIVDECHGADAKVLTRLVNSCVNAEYKIGLSGSIDKDAKINQLQLNGLFGIIKEFSTSKYLIDNGMASQLKINGIVLKYPQHLCRIVKNFAEYKDEVAYVNNLMIRKKYICKLAESRNNNTLILFRLTNFGKSLYEILSKKSKKKVFYVDGTVKDRESIRKYCEANNDAIIVASYGTFSTGISIKNLHNVIFAESMKSFTKIIQSIGRLLRLHKNKEFATLYDVTDDFSFVGKTGKKQSNYMLKHFLNRIEYYENEKLEYKVKTIEVK